ncbi:hypothetical protein EP7_005384 [Isosphaeraceae bacterium EP7]
MRLRRGRLGWLATTMVVLGILRTPFPEADFHNIRHHDTPGEVCAMHDHLLRWHPEAGVADDVAVLHWHWLNPANALPGGPVDSTPALHANIPDQPGTVPDPLPQIALDESSSSPAAGRLVTLDPIGPGLTPFLLDAFSFWHPPSMAPVGSHPRAPRPAASPLALLQRWTC